MSSEMTKKKITNCGIYIQWNIIQQHKETEILIHSTYEWTTKTI